MKLLVCVKVSLCFKDTFNYKLDYLSELFSDLSILQSNALASRQNQNSVWLVFFVGDANKPLRFILIWKRHFDLRFHALLTYPGLRKRSRMLHLNALWNRLCKQAFKVKVTRFVKVSWELIKFHLHIWYRNAFWIAILLHTSLPWPIKIALQLGPIALSGANMWNSWWTLNAHLQLIVC